MKSKERFSYIFLICGLVGVITLLVFLYFSGVLFASNSGQISNISLTETKTIRVMENGANVLCFDISGGLIPGQELPLKTNILNNSETSVYVRVKVVLNDGKNDLQSIKLKTTEKFVSMDDGYYYFIDEVLTSQTIGLSSALILGEDCVLSNDFRYIVSIIVEGVSTNIDMESIWGINIEQVNLTE